MFEISLNNLKNGKWCPYCCSRKLCTNENCNLCFNKSFASHPKSIYWSEKNKLKPRQVFLNSNKKYWFNCDKSIHSFATCLISISNGTWCPKCKHKTELKLYNWLKILYPTIQSQKIFDWSKTDKSYRKYDFYIEELKLLIELDGRQHFVQVSNWTTPEQNQINDKIKNQLALNNNLNIIRICQQDVFYNKNNWDKILLNIIKNLSNDPKIYKIGKIYN